MELLMMASCGADWSSGGSQICGGCGWEGRGHRAQVRGNPPGRGWREDSLSRVQGGLDGRSKAGELQPSSA
jgi:hypothetical protein